MQQLHADQKPHENVLLAKVAGLLVFTFTLDFLHDREGQVEPQAAGHVPARQRFQEKANASGELPVPLRVHVRGVIKSPGVRSTIDGHEVSIQSKPARLASGIRHGIDGAKRRVASMLLVLAFITDPHVVKKILDHLHLPSTDPPLAPVRLSRQQVEMALHPSTSPAVRSEILAHSRYRSPPLTGGSERYPTPGFKPLFPYAIRG